MKQIKIFRVIQRINSVLFFLLLVGGLGYFVFLSFQFNQWQHVNTVEVNETDKLEKKIKLRLGRLHEINGHNSSYVELYSEGNSKKFSSYPTRQIRNILFFVGKNVKSHWLYNNQLNLIISINPLSDDADENKKNPVISLAITLIKFDTNGDGILSDKDSKVISLIDPYGSNYTEIEDNITEIIDTNVVNNGKEFMLLVQIDSNIVMKKYSLIDFKKISLGFSA